MKHNPPREPLTSGAFFFFMDTSLSPENLVYCQHCDCMAPVKIEQKANNLVTTCRNCRRFIKNLPHVPHEEKQDFTFYFGKYKDTPLSLFNTPDHISWLRWVINTNAVKQWQKELIIKHIND